MAHFDFVHDLDEAAYALGREAWPPFEVPGFNGLAPSGDSGESHGGVVKLDELVGVFTLVNAVGKEGRHLDLVVDADIIRDDVVGSVVGSEQGTYLRKGRMYP